VLGSPGMRLMLPSIAYTGIEIAEFQDGEEILERHKGINSPAQKPAPGTGAKLVENADNFS
jgi:hypothetical protein